MASCLSCDDIINSVAKYNHIEFALELVRDIINQVKGAGRKRKVINELTQLYSHLSMINKKLGQNMQRLKNITGNLARVKSTLNKKYCRNNNELNCLKKELHKNYFDTVHALVLAEEARDPYMHGHTERVTEYALSIARGLNLAEHEIELLRYAAEVHDIGKISIPDFILSKPGKLTPAERAIIELHPAKGAEMLEPLEFLKPALPIVRHHHEHYDGTGYPDRLQRERIPVLARILACADSFDAMTSDRPYRNQKLTVEEALAEIKNNSGSQFDPHIANSFIRSIRSQNR
ncbi:MAG: HD-GYP domain-containing protein [Candidatus Omnitrophota bacterium]